MAHICVVIMPSLADILSWCLSGAKPISAPMLVFCYLCISDQNATSFMQVNQFDNKIRKWRPFLLDPQWPQGVNRVDGIIKDTKLMEHIMLMA